MENVIIKKSKIHGRGVFANRDFRKGEIIMKLDISDIVSVEDFKKMSSEELKRVSFMEGKHRVMYEPENCVNYSCDSNSKTINFCDVAIRDIKKGEEITAIPSFDRIKKCNCGSKNCKE